MREFTYTMPTHIVFQAGAFRQAPDYANRLEMKNPLLVMDRTLMQLPFGKELCAAFPDAPVFCDVEVNPTISSVNRCALFVEKHKCDGIIVLGGGSCIDTAKGASVAATAHKDVALFLDGRENRLSVPKHPLPIIAIPTTSGTGSEVSQYAVISDETTLRKDSVSSNAICPAIALVDPLLTIGLPRSLTISTGLDVMSHALEAMLSKIENPLTDVLALEALRIVFHNLPICVEYPEEKEARSHMGYASTLAGIAMSHCCGTLPHGMGCPLSGHYQVPHGLAVGVLQRYALLHMGHEKDEECYRIMKSIEEGYTGSPEEAKDALIQKIDDLFLRIGCPKDLAEYHLNEEGIARMADDAMVHGCTSLNPVEVNRDEVIAIYREVRGSL